MCKHQLRSIDISKAIPENVIANSCDKLNKIFAKSHLPFSFINVCNTIIITCPVTDPSTLRTIKEFIKQTIITSAA